MPLIPLFVSGGSGTVPSTEHFDIFTAVSPMVEGYDVFTAVSPMGMDANAQVP